MDTPLSVPPTVVPCPVPVTPAVYAGESVAQASATAPARAPRPRLEYLDVLRVLATFAVVFDHVANQKWYYGPKHPAFPVLHFYESLVHWAVPIFVMISGALFLGKPVSVQKIYTKYIRHIVTAFLFWSAIYAVFDFAQSRDLWLAVQNFFTGQLHMWYMYMIIGLYMMIPFLQPIAANKKLTEYFIVLALVFGFGAYQLVNFLTRLDSVLLPVVQTINSYFCIWLVGGYSLYFLLGYYLSHYKLSRGGRHTLEIIGIIGMIATTALSFMMSYKFKEANNAFFDNITLNLVASSVGIFVWIKHRTPHLPAFLRRAATGLSPFCFGIYLIHPFFIMLLEHFEISALTFEPVLSVPILAIVIFTLSLGLSMLIRSIPYLGSKVT